jgi:hypothetical protein
VCLWLQEEQPWLPTHPKAQTLQWEGQKHKTALSGDPTIPASGRAGLILFYSYIKSMACFHFSGDRHRVWVIAS